VASIDKGTARAATTAVHNRRATRRLVLGGMCWFLLAANAQLRLGTVKA
jgi:hypothetical protein